MKNRQPSDGRTIGARTAKIAIWIAFIPFATGCIVGKQKPAATQPATAVGVEQSRPAYWWDKPAVAHVTGRSFDAVWDACRDALRERGFMIDRSDYREGVLTTLPRVSKNAVEVWRNDVVDPKELADSSLSTIHRIIRIDIKRLDDGGFQATPKVLVERFAMIERRITSVAQYRDIFSIRPVDATRANEEYGEAIPAYYWYPVGRDYALERQLARDARSKLDSKT